MKTLFFLLTAFILTGCSAGYKPRQGYEIYKTRHTNDEQIKQDMRECGFPDVNNGASYLVGDKNGYINSVICMEKRGYTSAVGRKGICSVHTETEACQKHLRETQSKKN